MIDSLLSDIKKHLANSLWFVKWLSTKPTGQFIIKVDIGQGSVRGKPKVSITENV